MKLAHLSISVLTVTASNMRHEKKAPDISDILPSIRERGILQPILVRPTDEDTYEVVAGRRRYYAAKALASETGTGMDLPCAIMEAGDDASALEASLIENVVRSNPSEMQSYFTFSKLFKAGMSAGDIAKKFALTEKQVEQRLALGNLLPAIRDLYTADQIDVGAVRALTLASTAQQKEWLALFKQDEAPTSQHGIKAWLFDDQTISIKAAIFDIAEYKGHTVTDLFSEESYFVDVEQFRQLQNAAIAARVEKYKAKGWPVEIIEPGKTWNSYQYEKATKKAGGKVYIAVGHDGRVSIGEGYLSYADAQKARKRQQSEDAGESAVATSPRESKPEVTAPQNTYIEAHRQAGIRAALVKNPATAFRLLVAHLLAGSEGIKAHHQRLSLQDQKIMESVSAQDPDMEYVAYKAQALSFLGLDRDDDPVLTGRRGSAIPLFEGLLKMGDSDVMEIAAVIMAECLDAGSKAGEAAGKVLGVDLAHTWKADDLFFEQLRDKEVIGAMLAEVAGQGVADAHLTATGKIKKGIIKDCLTGKNGREKTAWLPRWLKPEIGTYTDRGGIDLARPDVSYQCDDDDIDDILGDEIDGDDIDDGMEDEAEELAA